MKSSTTVNKLAVEKNECSTSISKPRPGRSGPPFVRFGRIIAIGEVCSGLIRL